MSLLQLTTAQLMIWLGQQLQPNHPIHNIAFQWEYDDKLNAQQFKHAFETVITASDALNMVINEKGGSVFQQIRSEQKLNFHIIDAHSWGENKLQEFIDVERKKQFDIASCCYEGFLIQQENRSIFLFKLHHIIADALTVSMLYNAITEVYQNPEYRVEFSFFEEQVLQQQQFSPSEKIRSFWESEVRNAEQCVLYGKKHVTAETEIIPIEVDLGVDRTEKIRDLVSLPAFRAFTTDLSFFQFFASISMLALHEVTSQDKITVGTPVHNRTTPKEKNTPGLFMELFPLTVPLEPDDTFASFYKRVSNNTFSLLKHAVSGASTPEIAGCFTVFFNYVSAKFSKIDSVGEKSSWINSDHVDPNHHLRIQIHDYNQTDRFQLFLECNQSHFNQDSANRFKEHFLSVLDQVLADPQMNLADLSVVTKAEKKAYDKTPVTTFATTSIVDLLHQSFQTHGKEIAVDDGSNQLTYNQLFHKAQALASNLSERVPDHAHVAIHSKRNCDYAVAVVACLLGGYSFTPIPYRFPEERLQYIIEDSGAFAILSNSNRSSLTTLSISELSKSDGQASFLEPTGDDLALLLYTSGSTGKPKGVKLTHNALHNYFAWAKDYYLPGQPVNSPLFASIGFDLTMNTLLLPLVTGGCCYAYPEHDDESGLEVVDALANPKVNLFTGTPTHLELAKDKLQANQSLKMLVIAGEAFHTGLVKTYKDFFGQSLRIINLYGPTEATIGCTVHEYNEETDQAPTLPIGVPISNMNAIILNKHNQPVAQGVPGELFLGGDSVSIGYQNNNELTADRFIVLEQFGSTPFYRTGDLARLNEAFELEYLGRNDSQIKLRGQRIELAEIEIVLAEAIHNSRCAVVLNSNHSHLFAYYEGEAKDEETILEILTERLPNYMIPSKIVHMQSLPTSANGKVNRKALPIEVDGVVGEPIVHPRNDIEELVCSIWKEVLDVDRLGIHAHFISQGGNSLSAIKITSRIKDAFHLAIPLRTVFDKPTIAQYAKVLSETIERKLLEMS